MDLDVLYHSAFDCGAIGWSVGPQTDAQLLAVVSAIFWHFDAFGRLAAQRPAASSWTQKTRNRAVERLSNDVQVDQVRTEMSRLFIHWLTRPNVFSDQIEVKSNEIHLNESSHFGR